jgi:outer membrane lipoprotein SlyB
MSITLVLILCLSAGACATGGQGKVYTEGEAKQAYTVKRGEVTSVREVAITGEKSLLGTLGGAVIGGALGSAVGSGSGRRIATALGLVGGAVAGGEVEKRAKEKSALEISVKLDDGGEVVIVQEADEQFGVGDRVRVLEHPRDRSTRVTH